MDPEAFNTVLADIATHGNTRRALRENGGNFKAFYGLLARDSEARERYARAKELGIDAMADELLEIADDGTGDTWIDDDGVTRTNNDVVQRSKLRVDARKWLLSKILPKRYGDALNLKHDGQVAHSLIINRDPKPKEAA